jgi:hypothetical protein
MASPALHSCRVAGCAREAVRATSADLLCLDHFLHQTFARASESLSQCQQDQPLDPATLEWLLEDARQAVQLLIGTPGTETAAERDKLLDLLLSLANLQEYIRHHSIALAPREQVTSR